MDTIVLIDNENLKPIKHVPTLEQAQYWAELLLPKTDYYVTDTNSNRSFAIFSEYEARCLYYNLTGEHASQRASYSEVLSGLRSAITDMDLDETPLETLSRHLGLRLAAPEDGVPTGGSFAPTSEPPEKKASTPRKQASGPAKRPKAGTTTARVWDIADELHELDSTVDKHLRAQVLEACEREGINKATASTQFGKWKKALEASE